MFPTSSLAFAPSIDGTRIGVAGHSDGGETAAAMANAFVSEYLRGQRLTELTDFRARAERDLLNLSSVFGVRHPSYVRAQARVDPDPVHRSRALRGAAA